jgi:hypothetical protein
MQATVRETLLRRLALTPVAPRVILDAGACDRSDRAGGSAVAEIIASVGPRRQIDGDGQKDRKTFGRFRAFSRPARKSGNHFR